MSLIPALRRLTLALLLLALTAATRADEIQGVQPVAIDQPRIYMRLAHPGADQPLSAKVDGADLSAIEAFLDTGAGGIVLSRDTADALAVAAEQTAAGQPVTFQDVGIGGTEDFSVSPPLVASFAPYSSVTDGANDGAYVCPTQPIRCQIRPSDGFLEMLTGALDIAGMPAMAGKVVVIDARPANTFTDKLKTSLHEPGDPAIPPVDKKIALTYVSFAPFNRLLPPDGPAPIVAANPMIGPDPFGHGAANPPVLLAHGGQSVRGTLLLDTGAPVSMISTAIAKSLGVTYAEDHSHLLGVPENEQFELNLGGIGGNKTMRGFYLDGLQLPTTAGDAIRFAKAPVLVNDITVVDAKTGEPFTLDGILGMNFLVATANVTGGLLPDIGQLTAGAFQTIVIDHAKGTLGVK